MPAPKPYGLICPITRACDLLEPRWTIPILVALWGGETRFNELRRAIGSISPALLSRRLKEMEELGLVERVADRGAGTVDYIRTDMAVAPEPALNALAKWAQQCLEAEFALCTASVSNLMWKMRRMIDVTEMPRRRVVIQFHFNEPAEYDTYWALVQPEAPVEICVAIPGFPVDLFVETTTPSLLGIILGRTTVARELDLGQLFLSGDARLVRTMPRWLPVDGYGRFEGIPALAADRPRPGRLGQVGGAGLARAC